MCVCTSESWSRKSGTWNFSLTNLRNACLMPRCCDAEDAKNATLPRFGDATMPQGLSTSLTFLGPGDEHILPYYTALRRGVASNSVLLFCWGTEIFSSFMAMVKSSNTVSRPPFLPQCVNEAEMEISLIKFMQVSFLKDCTSLGRLYLFQNTTPDIHIKFFPPDPNALLKPAQHAQQHHAHSETSYNPSPYPYCYHLSH